MELQNTLKGYINENGKFNRFPGKRQKIKQALMLQYLAAKFDLDVEFVDIDNPV